MDTYSVEYVNSSFMVTKLTTLKTNERKKAMDDKNDPRKECPWCGQWTYFEVVRGHLECPVCRNPVADCCDGETACED